MKQRLFLCLINLDLKVNMTEIIALIKRKGNIYILRHFTKEKITKQEEKNTRRIYFLNFETTIFTRLINIIYIVYIVYEEKSYFRFSFQLIKADTKKTTSRKKKDTQYFQSEE